MALVSNSVIFNFPAPNIAEIISRVEEISGLPVCIIEDDGDNCHDSEDMGNELYDMYHEIAFSDFADNTLLIYSYKPGEILKSTVEDLGEKYKDYLSQMVIGLEGADEKEGQQSIYLQTYLGRELSLYYASIIALLSLMGEAQKPIQLEKERKRFPLNKVILEQKTKRNRWLFRLYFIIQVFLLPVSLLMSLLSVFKFVVPARFLIKK